MKNKKINIFLISIFLFNFLIKLKPSNNLIFLNGFKYMKKLNTLNYY